MQMCINQGSDPEDLTAILFVSCLADFSEILLEKSLEEVFGDRLWDMRCRHCKPELFGCPQASPFYAK